MSDTHNHIMRLQRFLSRSGVASRRGSEKLMSAGRVSVNGEIVRELGTKVNCERDTVRVDGKEVLFSHEPVYLMLYKPKGFLSTMHDPFNRPCITELVPTEDIPGLFCVGRLDKDTTGLLLFTTDGLLAEHMLHPRYENKKEYLVLIEGCIDEVHIKALEKGIMLEDGICAPAKVTLHPQIPSELKKSFFSHGVNTQAIKLTIHEGKKHIVKRMLEACGHPVLELHRTTFGPLELKDLGMGQYRHLENEEIRIMKQAEAEGLATFASKTKG